MMAGKVTHTLLLVLQAILEFNREAYGLEIANKAGINRGVAYPILGRLQGVGVLTARWDTEKKDVPARKYYTLVPERRAEVVELLTKRGIELPLWLLRQITMDENRPAS